MNLKVDLPISDANVVLILDADPLAETCSPEFKYIVRIQQKNAVFP